MSLAVTATFVLADWIVKGLADGTFERVGGVIREVGTKQVVTWLREANSVSSGIPLAVEPSSSVINLMVSGANTVISAKGFTDVNQRLDGIEMGLQAVKLLPVSTAVSILNLGISVIGFAVVAKRLGEIEKRLKQTQENINNIERKIDIALYANFRAALDLAHNAFSMTQTKNRVNMAAQAVNRFLEAQHIYTNSTDIAIEQDIQFANEHLSLLFLSYIAEALCYLELEEFETANQCLKISAENLNFYVKKYIKNTVPYLQDKERRELREKYPQLSSYYGGCTITVNGVITGTYDGFWSSWFEPEPTCAVVQALQPFPSLELMMTKFKPTKNTDKFKMKEKVETIIETNRRFEAYQSEVQALAQLGISFHDWLKLAPSEVRPDGAELMYIIPARVLTV